MKTIIRKSLAAVVAAAYIALAVTPRVAQACDACTNRTEIKIPEQAADILKILHEHDDMVAAAVKNKKLPPVSRIVITMSAYARALPGKATADKRGAATNALTSFRIVSKELLRTAILEKQDESAAQAKQLHAALIRFDACFNYKPNLAQHETH